jgi:hypothetical protein
VITYVNYILILLKDDYDQKILEYLFCTVMYMFKNKFMLYKMM